MKRVCIVTSGLRVGGVERKLTDLVQHTAAVYSPEEVAVDLIIELRASPDENENVLLRLLQATRCRVLFKPKYTPLLLYLLWYVFWHKPDTILAYSRRPSIFACTVRALLRWRKIRVVLGNDTLASQALVSFNPQVWRQRLVAAQMRLFYPRADLILVPSDNSKNDLVANFSIPPEKIRVLKNWTRLAPTFIAPKTIDLIYVGRVDALKNLTRLVEIAAAVRESFSSLRVMIVGGGVDLENVRDALRAHQLQDTFELVGFQSDIGTFLARAKIFCLTSRFEGMPLAALEAMAFGLPVVTTAYPGAQELVRQGETGFVCRDNNAYRDAILELLTDDARRTMLGQHAREFVECEHGAQVLEAYCNYLLQPHLV